MTPKFMLLFTSCLSLGLTSVAHAQQEERADRQADEADAPPAQPGRIVVQAERLRGQLNVEQPPLLELNEEDMAKHPHALFGSVDAICDELERRRELHGISYVTVGKDNMESFAPVVERLAGN